MGLLLFFAVMFLVLVTGAVLAITGFLVWGGLFREVYSDIRHDWRVGLLYLVVMTALVVLAFLAETAGWGVALVGWMAFLFVLGLVATIRNPPSRSGVPRKASKSNQPITVRVRRRVVWARRRVRPLIAGRWWRRSIITVFVLTLAVVALTLVGDARLGAAKVLGGEAWRSTFGGMPLTSMEARPATVVWSSGTPPGGLQLGDDHCLLYLGQSDGITVFYDAAARRSIRLPSSDVTVSVRNEDPACA